MTQYHYLSWPDHGVPVEAHPLLEMMSEIEAERSDKQKTKTPMVVHCRYVVIVETIERVTI